MLDSPVRSGDSETPANPAPKLGQHTDDVLRGLGYDDEKLAELKAGKVI
jgi:crotonobetainyl-CoA:carnitine CoA-transferase CaiB-like acyl-CoA transferase